MKKEILPYEPGNSPLVVDTGEQAGQTFRARTRDQGGEDILLPSPLHSTPLRERTRRAERVAFCSVRW